MANTQFNRDNHYVPRVYLKSWESTPNRVWKYSTLVHDERAPLWRERSTEGIAYYSHLYTKIIAGHETDEVERWFSREFEDPVEPALKKVTSEERLTPADWQTLVRFLAAQDVRTPARLIESMKRWGTTLPKLLDDTLRSSVRRLELASRQGERLRSPKDRVNTDFPIRVTTERINDEEAALRVEAIAGRGLWLFSIDRLLTKTAKVLLEHKWTILSPPKGIAWFTSDDPVVKLNYSATGNYDFGGGWGYPGTEIFLPLGPKHLLYTQVGKRPPPRGTVLPYEQAEMICRFIAEHAHRMIFAAEPDARVPKLRPRVASREAIENEKQQWRKWHDEQAAAERELLGLNEATEPETIESSEHANGS